jgi:hypothetical protein
MNMRRLRPSPAMVVASMALVISLGGVGYAAGLIGTSDIKNGAVTSPKLGPAAVRNPKIHDGAVTGAKVLDNSLTGNDIDESTLGQVPSAASLQGLGPAAFEKPGRILFGFARIDDNIAHVLISAPSMNLILRTTGNSSQNTQFLLGNGNTSGNLIGTPFTRIGAGAPFGILHGTSSTIGPASGNGTDFFDALIADTSSARSMWLHCLINFDGGNPVAFCWGVLSATP